MKIGLPAPPWRVPMYSNGTLTFSSLSHFRGRPLVLCCPHSLTSRDAFFLEGQINSFQDRHAALAAFLSSDITNDLARTLHDSGLHLPLLTDPLKRLSRSLGLSRHLAPQRCETLLFGQVGRLEFRLIHDLNLRGISRALEVAERQFAQDTHTPTNEPWAPLPPTLSNREKVGVHERIQLSI